MKRHLWDAAIQGQPGVYLSTPYFEDPSLDSDFYESDGKFFSLYSSNIDFFDDDFNLPIIHDTDYLDLPINEYPVSSLYWTKGRPCLSSNPPNFFWGGYRN